MKKFFLSFFVFLASAAYVAYQYIGGSPASAAVATTTVPQTTQTTQIPVSVSPTPVQITTPPATPVVAPTPIPTPPPTGQYADGTYTGSQADAYYGTVQIQAVIQNGKLTAVTFLQYPNDRRTSQYINAQAMPQLKAEAIVAQSATVSGVSGASDTSQAFKESLGNALAQAKNS